MASASRNGHRLQRCRNGPAGRIEDGVERRIVAAAGGVGHLMQQLIVRAVLQHLVFLPVEAHLRKGARFGQRTHAEQSLPLADGHARAIVPGSDLGHLQRRLEAVRSEGEDIRNRRRLGHVAAQAIIHHQFARGAIEFGGGLARFGVRQQVAENVGPQLVESRPVTQLAAQRFLASEVNTAARPSPYCQRTSSGSSGSARRIRSVVDSRQEAHVAAQRRRGLDAHAIQNFGALHHFRLHVLFHRRGAGMLLHVAQHDLLQPGGSFRKYDLPCAKLRHFFQERAVDVLPQPDRGDSDVVGDGFLR
jgi:hypothetical protein